MSSISLYTGLLVEAGRNTSHQDIPADPIKAGCQIAEGINPICGDQVKWYFRVDSGEITKIRYEVKGCLMSRASASLLARFLENKTVEEARGIYANILNITDLAQEQEAEAISSDELESKPWLALAQIREYPSRRKCVTMAWDSFFKELRA